MNAGGTEARLIGGRYELQARIGRGGIGEVWRARHVALNSFVAIKFLQGASAQNEAARRRFTTEAQVTARLNSRHAVQVFDFGVTDDGHPYLVMELLEGETLGRRIERDGRVAIIDAARMLGQSARALYRAHQLGIVHRDFKPDNVVIGIDDEGRDYVKVVDFGLAKLVGELDALPDEHLLDLATTAPSATFTKTGAMLGTPFYMAPEQIRNAADVDLRADIWAFGVVAFECLTGCTPFAGDTLLELFTKIEKGEHPQANELDPSIPPGFNAWFDEACAPDSRDRFPDANTAWKKLIIALECGRIDIDPSVTMGRSLPPSGENHVVVLGEPADANAVTLHVEAAGEGKGVASRQRRSLRRTSDALVQRANTAPAATEPAAASLVAVAREPLKERPVAADARVAATPRGSGAGMRALAVAIPLLVLAGVVTWRATLGAALPPDRAVEHVQSSRVEAPPIVATAESAVPSALAAPSPSSLAASSTPPAPSASSSRVSPSHARPRPSAIPSAAASATASRAAPTATAPSPPLPSANTADLGSYR